MANTNFTLPSTEQSRDGAMACIEALRAIEVIAETSFHRSQNDKDGTSMEEWWHKQDTVVAKMFQQLIAERQSDFIAGFVAVFAEYAFFINSSGVPNLHRWQPEAAMTEEEKAAYRAKFTADVEEFRLS
jgi:hypothetical protein